MSRGTKTITANVSKQEIEMYEYITAGDVLDMQNRDAAVGATEYLVKRLITRIGDVKDNVDQIYSAFRDLPFSDYKQLDKTMLEMMSDEAPKEQSSDTQTGLQENQPA